MAFFEQQFDPRLSFGARGGPVWRTTKVVTKSGHRNVDREWAYPLHRYNVAQAIKDNADFELARAFHYVVAGSFDGFRFKDWADYRLTKTNSRLVDTSESPTEWQIARVYSVASREFLRPIKKPCASPALAVYRTRSTVESLASATVDTTTGLVQIAGHQTGDTYTCVGEFDVPCAFADDALEADIADNGDDGFLVRWDSIVIEEIRL